ncbi:helix-turn-helix domain-containing protein [Paracoccus sp. MA]|uniref:helix-turn-helix domain-containing protein n=1 Tax=Paracoccus sp. MA TaxID=2895796 RepID=UPI001E4F5198|nr:helix-turn-helix transcriptional regulator [Paracoccus sp. MA]UFM65025.1 helix-turn-helix domain-containing protein [Paracoccus sp. MA]
MNGKTPQTHLDIRFDDDDLDGEAWLQDDFDSFEPESKRAPVAPVGAILKQARRKIEEKGISQEEMARRLGIPKRTYIAYESQEVPKVPAEVLRRLAAISDIDAEFILTGRVRHCDYGPILEEIFELQTYIVAHFRDGEDQISYEDLRTVVYEVLSDREQDRWWRGDPTIQYTKADIVQAVRKHTKYGKRYWAALDDDGDASSA